MLYNMLRALTEQHLVITYFVKHVDTHNYNNIQIATFVAVSYITLPVSVCNCRDNRAWGTVDR